MKYNSTGVYQCNEKCKGCQPLALNRKQFISIVSSLRDVGEIKLATQVLKLERVVVSCPQTDSYAFFPVHPDEFRNRGDI